MNEGASGQGDTPVSTFLVERYWPGVSSRTLEAAVARGVQSANEMRHGGTRIQYLRSTLLPADETVFCLFEALTAADVAELNERAEIPFDRIVETVALVPEVLSLGVAAERGGIVGPSTAGQGGRS